MTVQIDFVKHVLEKNKDLLASKNEDERKFIAKEIIRKSAGAFPQTPVTQQTSEVLSELEQIHERDKELWLKSGGSDKAIPVSTNLKTARRNAELQKMGVSTDEDLPAGDWKLGFGVDQQKDVKNVLSDYFGKDVDVFKSQEDLIYINPETKKPTKINLGLIASAGQAIPMATDVAATIAAGVGGGVAGTVAKETLFSGAGTFAGELIRLGIGSALGVHDLDAKEIAAEAAKKGAEAAAFTGGIGGAISLVKGVENFVKGGIFTKAEAEKYGLSTEEADNVISEVNKIIKLGGSEKEVKGTLYQKTGDIQIGSKQAEIEKSGEHAARFKEREISDQSALSEAIDITSKPVLKPYAGTEDIGDIATKRVEKRVNQAKDIVSRNTNELETQLSNIGKVQKESVGEPTAEYLAKKQEIAKAAEDAQWDKVKRIGGYDEEAKKYGIDIAEGEKTAALKSQLKRRTETSTTKIAGKGTAGVFKAKPQKADLADYNREISDLRSEMRAASKNKQFATTQTRDMNATVNAMVEDRRLALVNSGKVDVLDQIEKAEAETAMFHKIYDRSVVGDLTKINDKGVPVIKSKKFVDEILKRDEVEVDQLLSVIGDNPELMMQWKEGIGNAYKQVAFKENKFNKEASENFIRSNESVLSKFFSKEEIAGFKGTGTLAKKVEDQVARLQKFKSIANNKWGSGALQKVDPEGLVRFITNKSGSWATPSGRGVQEVISKVKYVKNITKDNPAAWQGLQNSFRTNIKESILEISGENAGRINPKKLSEWVTRPENARVIKEVLGEDYYKNLSKINAVAQLLSKQAKHLGVSEERMAILQSLRAGIAPPLTRRGRAFTAAVIFDNKRSHAAMADAILDENKIKKVANLAEHDVITRRIAEKAFSLGFMIPQENEQ